MEIGSKVTWEAANKIMQGLFLEEKEGIAEIICYQMGQLNCHLRVFVDFNLIKSI